MTKNKPLKQWAILAPFRLNGRWYRPHEKTVSLTPAQASMLSLNNKVGALKRKEGAQ